MIQQDIIDNRRGNSKTYSAADGAQEVAQTRHDGAVLLARVGQQRNHGRLHRQAQPHSLDHQTPDNRPRRGPGAERDAPAGAGRPQHVAAPDDGVAAAEAADDEAAGARGEREAEDEGQDHDAGDEGRLVEDDLVVEREVVQVGVVDDAADEVVREEDLGRAPLEEAERHGWVAREAPFDEDEGEGEEAADDQEGDDEGGAPVVCCAPSGNWDLGSVSDADACLGAWRVCTSRNITPAKLKSMPG